MPPWGATGYCAFGMSRPASRSSPLRPPRADDLRCFLSRRQGGSPPDHTRATALQVMSLPCGIWIQASIRATKGTDFKGDIHSVVFSLDGERIAASAWRKSEDGPPYMIDIWTAYVGQLLSEYRPFKHGHASQARFSPDGKILAAVILGRHGRRRADSPLGMSPRERTTTLQGQESSRASPFLPTGNCWPAGLDKTVPSLGREDRKEVERFSGETMEWSPFVGFTADGKTLVRAVAQVLHVWDVAARKDMRTIKGDCGTRPEHAALSPDGNILVVTSVPQEEAN